MPQHVPGQPADATTVGFDWNNPLNAGEVGRLQETLDIITRCRRVASDEVDAVDNGVSLLAVATARHLDLLANLPPFPLPGQLAGLKLADLRIFFAFWQASLVWMSSPQTVPVTDSTGTTNVTDTPLAVFRRVMDGVGTW